MTDAAFVLVRRRPLDHGVELERLQAAYAVEHLQRPRVDDGRVHAALL